MRLLKLSHLKIEDVFPCIPPPSSLIPHKHENIAHTFFTSVLTAQWNFRLTRKDAEGIAGPPLFYFKANKASKGIECHKVRGKPSVPAPTRQSTRVRNLGLVLQHTPTFLRSWARSPALQYQTKPRPGSRRALLHPQQTLPIFLSFPSEFWCRCAHTGQGMEEWIIDGQHWERRGEFCSKAHSVPRYRRRGQAEDQTKSAIRLGGRHTRTLFHKCQRYGHQLEKGYTGDIFRESPKGHPWNKSNLRWN